MNALTRTIAAAIAAACPLVAPLAQALRSPAAIDQFAQMQSELRSSHAGGDTATYLKGSESLYAFLNGSPRATLQLMSAEAAAAQPDEAVRSFAQYVAMGQAGAEVQKSKSFDPLRALPTFQRLLADMAANATSVCTATEAFKLQSSVRIPEDIDYDAANQHFFISTVLGQQIIQVDMNGHTKSFADAPDHWPMMALKIDAQRGVLWATEVALDGFASAAKADWGRSAVLEYDMSSAKLLHRIEGPPQASLGDMALTANGDAIVSDGEHGGVYRVSRSTQRIERIDAGDFVSPQTPAVLADGKHVLVPDYVRGIGLLDLKTKRVVWLPAEGKHALNGIDGLYATGGTLIATQNGASPERVVRFVIDDSTTRVLSENIIERATPTLGDPTHGVVVGDYFYYIANSGWDVLDDHGTLLKGKSLPISSVRRAKITEALSSSTAARPPPNAPRLGSDSSDPLSMAATSANE